MQPRIRTGKKTSLKKSRTNKKKAPHKINKRNHSTREQHRIQGKAFPKVVIPYITNANTFKLKNGTRVDPTTDLPQPGPIFEDPQGMEPYKEENRGVHGYNPYNKKNVFRFIAGVDPGPLPKTIPTTSQDTLYTYGKRVHRLQYKALVNAFREMEERRIERNYQIARRRADEIIDRARIYRDYKHRRFIQRQYDHTVRLQKHAAALAASYKRGQESQERLAVETANRQAKYIELMMQERRTTWIESETVDPKVFSEITPTPTGWWPIDDDQSLFMDKFNTDDQDKDNYFVTHYPPFTNIKPGRNDYTELMETVTNRGGWSKERQRLKNENDIIFEGLLDQAKPRGDDYVPKINRDLPVGPWTEDVVTARAGKRNRPFIRAEYDQKSTEFLRMYGTFDNAELKRIEQGAKEEFAEMLPKAKSKKM
eukprot:UN02138